MEQSQARYNRAGGFLLFSVSKIELNLHKGQQAEGCFTLEEQDGMNVEGYVYSSDFRMQVNNDKFSGENITIDYSFDTTGMNVGDVLKGNFYVISDRGEYVIPFVVMIQREAIDSSLGNIKNLFHFTNLAKSNWNEAIKVFYSPEFINIMSGNEAKYRNLYRGLSAKGSKNFNLEEFLIGINKKQKIEYIVAENSMTLNNPPKDLRATIKIDKNGWGYTMLGVKIMGDFIVPDKTKLDENDFEGNTCNYGFTLNYDRLHGGKNYGKLIFKHLYGSFEVEVCVIMNNFANKSVVARKTKSNEFAFVRYYLDYTCKKLSLQKWLSLSDEILTNGVSSINMDLSVALLKSHLLIIGERYNEAKWIIDKCVKTSIEDANNELYCYYLYILALYSDDDYYRREVTGQIRSIYENDKYNWRIAWILLKLSDDYKKSPEKKFAFAMNQVKLGCSSPIVYIEALKALSENPSMIMHMDDAILRVLLFGAKEGILSKDVMTQVSYLALKAKNYDRKLLRVMEYIYKRHDSDDVVQAVCVQLMKGDIYTEESFKWYSMAVERNLPLTRLYESYMLSMDLRKEIELPKRVLMYFSYQSALPVAQNAYIYAYVVKNMEEQQEIYFSYKDSIIRFVLKQLRAGKVDKNLAFLYSHYIMGELQSSENIRDFAKMMLMHCIVVEDSDITSVVVIDERLKAELIFPVSQRKAYVAILGNDYTILLEDSLGNRFCTTREYSIERFFMPGKVIPKLETYIEDTLLFDLHVCEDNLEFLIITDNTVGRYKYLESCEEISEEYRSRLHLPLIRYYMEKDDTKNVDELLNRLGYDDVTYKDYNEIIRDFIIRGMLDKAMEFALYYGADNIEPKTLVRLGERMIDRDGMIENKRLLSILIQAFERGKYDVEGLRFLVQFYRGPLKMLRNIWKAASNFYVDTYSICERMIIQTLNTGAYIGEEAEVLKQYVSGGAKTEVELEFLTYYAHEYFVHGRVVDDFIFNEIGRLIKNEKINEEVCMLAYLLHYSKGVNIKEIPEETKDNIKEFINILYTKKGISFPFFAAFKDISIEAMQISNRTLIEYRGNPKFKTTINYVFSKENDDEGGFCREEMVDMYGGIYVKEFLLFFGETLQYYITEEGSMGEQLTESGTVSKNDALGESDTDRYSLINDIAIADTLKDYDTAFRLLEEYKYKEYLIDNLFRAQ